MAGKIRVGLSVFEIGAMTAAKIIDDPNLKAAVQQ
jgi:hypothetical protein